MTRNLKVLLAAAMALAAFGAFSAAGAQAAEFHCDPAAGTTSCFFTLKPDGTTTTAHHVFVVKDAAGETASFTCPQLDGSGTAAQTAANVSITSLNYNTIVGGSDCKLAGVTVTVDMNGCSYNFSAGGTVSIVCPAGQVIEVTGPCTVKVGSQGPLNGITYHNLGTTAAGTTEITVSANVPGIAISEVVNPGGCFGHPGGPYTATYTTGNTIVTAETDTGAPAMTAGWWA
jgi:hypothetical protein